MNRKYWNCQKTESCLIKIGAKAQLLTMYKNNSGLITKAKVSKYKKGLCLFEKLVHKSSLLFLY